MISCPYCGHENPNDTHICVKCAASLASICSYCNHLVPLKNKYCGHCGTRTKAVPNFGRIEIDQSLESTQDLELMLMNLRGKMPTSMAEKIPELASESVGQRREVTVMFIDVANFTDTSHRLGSEDVFIMMDELMDSMVGIIYKYEGTIDKFTGDGLMALFGIPFNHENDPERAVRAALEIIESIRPQKRYLKTNYDLDLGIRIGINTGVVIAGKLGSKYHMEYTVIGDTVNLASRLEDYAEPDTTLVSFQTYKRVRHIFSIDIIPPISVKGYPYPIQVYRPTGVRSIPGRDRGKSGFLAPLIGRQEPLKKLDQSLAHMQKVKGSHFVFIHGEAGLGKTRLITEFRRTKTGSNLRFHSGSCASFVRVTPYHVLRRIIRNIMHISEIDSTRDQTDAVINHITFLGLNKNDVLPYILHVLGLPQVNLFSETKLRQLEPEGLQKQTHSALRKFLAAEAEFSTNTILILDDLHWVDQASKSFLDYFCQSIDDVPIMLILISRDFIEHPILDPQTRENLDAQNKLTHIDLQPLTKEETRILVDSIIPDDEAELEQVKAHIVQRGEGNPYFTEELVRVLKENQGLVQVDGQWRTTPKTEKVLDEIPGTLKDIVLARFDRLPENLQHILQKAAILGSSFALFLLQTQVNEDLDTLKEHLTTLEQKDFLNASLEGIDVVYSFKQGIVRDTIYETILKRDRMIYHYQVAQTIKTFTFWLPGEKSEILAYHLSESTKPYEAIQHLITAGENASNRYANNTASKHFREALTLLQDSAEIERIDYARARVGLGKSLKYAGNFNEALKVLQNAMVQMVYDYANVPEKKDRIITLLIDGYREIADIKAREGYYKEGLSTLEKGIAHLGDAPEKDYPGFWRILIDRAAWIHFRQGDLEMASSKAKQALQKADEWGKNDPITLASLNNTMGGVHWMQSRFNEAIRYVQNSLDIYNEINYHWGRAIAATNLGVLHFSSGQWNEAVKHFEQAESIQVEQGYKPDRPTNLKNLGEVLMNLGNFEAARKHLTTSQQISRQLGMSINEAYAEIGLCRLCLYEGNVKEAEEHLWNAEFKLEDTKDEIDDRNISLMLLDAILRSRHGEFEDALDIGVKALEMAEEGGFPGEMVEAKRILGRLYTKTGKFDSAEPLLLDSLQLAKEQNTPYLEARAHFELGRLQVAKNLASKQDQSPEEYETWANNARSEFNLAIELFSTLGAQYDLKLARRSLNQIEYQ